MQVVVANIGVCRRLSRQGHIRLCFESMNGSEIYVSPMTPAVALEIAANLIAAAHATAAMQPQIDALRAERKPADLPLPRARPDLIAGMAGPTGSVN